MKVIDFMNEKGGVGKTSSSVACAVELAQRNKNVIFIDIDHQGNSSGTLLGNQAIIKNEITDILLKKCSLQDVIISTQVDNLKILPTRSGSEMLKIYNSTLSKEEPFACRKLVRTIKDEFPDTDYVIIDSAPGMTGLVQSALMASNEAIIVMELAQYAQEGLLGIFSSVENLHDRYETDQPQISKIICNKYNAGLSVQNVVLNELKGMEQKGYSLYVIPVDQGFPKSQKMSVPLQFLSGVKSETLETIRNICDSLEEVNNG